MRTRWGENAVRTSLVGEGIYSSKQNWWRNGQVEDWGRCHLEVRRKVGLLEGSSPPGLIPTSSNLRTKEYILLSREIACVSRLP